MTLKTKMQELRNDVCICEHVSDLQCAKLCMEKQRMLQRGEGRVYAFFQERKGRWPPWRFGLPILQPPDGSIDQNSFVAFPSSCGGKIQLLSGPAWSPAFMQQLHLTTKATKSLACTPSFETSLDLSYQSFKELWFSCLPSYYRITKAFDFCP